MENKLFSVQEHLGKTWEIFKLYGLKLALLNLIPAVFGLILTLICGGLGLTAGGLLGTGKAIGVGTTMLIVLLPAVIIAVLALIYTAYWVSAAQINYLNTGQSDIEFWEILKSGRKFTLPLIGFSLISGFIIGGASMLFVLPGIIFSFFFIFGQYILVVEGRSVKQSLLTSREYLRGYEWPVVGRLLILCLGILVIWIPFWLLGLIPFVGPIFSQCAGIFIGAIFMCYFFVLYQEIVRIKGLITPESLAGKSLTKYTLVSILGWFVGLLAAVLIIAMTVLLTARQNGVLEPNQINNQIDVQNNVELKTE